MAKSLYRELNNYVGAGSDAHIEMLEEKSHEKTDDIPASGDVPRVRAW